MNYRTDLPIGTKVSFRIDPASKERITGHTVSKKIRNLPPIMGGRLGYSVKDKDGYEYFVYTRFLKVEE